jgi:glutamine amidotransferase
MNRESGERMFKGIKNNSFFYFVHSYYGKPKSNDGVAAKTDYGIPFCSAVLKGNVWGCQFHPEKSGEDGLKLLGNFVREVGKC